MVKVPKCSRVVLLQFLVLDVELLRSAGVRGGDGEGAGGECGTAQREGGARATLRDGATEKDSAREKRAPRPGGTTRVRRGLPALDSGAGTADCGPERGVVRKRHDCGVAGDDGRAAAQARWSASCGAARLGSALAVRDGAAPGVQQLAATRGGDGARGWRQRLAASSSRCSAMQGTADGQQFFVVMWPAQSCVCSVHATETNCVTARRASVRRRRTASAALQHVFIYVWVVNPASRAAVIRIGTSSSPKMPPPMAMATPAASATLTLLLPASPPMRLRARRPPARTSRSRPLLLRASCAYALREGQSQRFHRLPCGLDLEVIAQQPPAPATGGGGAAARPPLVFVHGSFHAAWCWAEHWLPFFSRAGFPCYALSLRAQGESSVPPEKVAGTLETHTGDIADFIRKEVSLPPVLIGHSFGGLIVQQYISCLGELLHPKLAGAVLVCSVPPSGNSGLVWRYLLTKPVAAIKVTLSLAAKRFANSLSLCKETFFSPEMDDDLVQRYQGLMRDSSKLPLFDLRKLNASLPVASVPNNTVNILVVGASIDFIVDAEGLSETARFYNVQPVCIEGIAHDMMLDCSWDKGAGIILSWLEKLTPR
uniref:AB hydrolase-1 domain-containing protein n=1 Tax=Oryza nivara TaxID=4536 RepID=A0A0E0GZS6_ORYNI